MNLKDGRSNLILEDIKNYIFYYRKANRNNQQCLKAFEKKTN